MHVGNKQVRLSRKRVVDVLHEVKAVNGIAATHGVHVRCEIAKVSKLLADVQAFDVVHDIEKRHGGAREVRDLVGEPDVLGVVAGFLLLGLVGISVSKEKDECVDWSTVRETSADEQCRVWRTTYGRMASISSSRP